MKRICTRDFIIFEEEEERECNQMEVLGRTPNHYDSQMAHVPQVQYQHFRSHQNTEPNRGGTRHFQPTFLYAVSTKDVSARAAIQETLRPDTNQQNQMGIVPNLFPKSSSSDANDVQPAPAIDET